MAPSRMPSRRVDSRSRRINCVNCASTADSDEGIAMKVAAIGAQPAGLLLLADLGEADIGAFA
jgi:hypothetical protein